MNKIYAIYAEVEVPKPDKWLTDFRKKYSEPYDFHITLKQPCNIQELDASKIREKLERFFKNPKKQESFEVIFDYLFAPEQKSCIMIGLKSGQNRIYDLQKELVDIVQDYSDYAEPKSEQWEKNFVPHLTIGDDLNDERHLEAIKDLPGKIEIKGLVKQIVLVVAKEARPEQSLNPNNLIKFGLK
ncbi:hypothetical protein C4544_04335 [candidate division WS5 bacterium]|uniref:2'-5' RNA ligase family protein n=1 Tax=candidate division WS5 bacterium TaxID=2093353 RepID=A0A419DCP1_9BACT|nr:MAG: hypothetical protein C4544_04335 [candidate division WS5 bacterium]